MYVCFGFLVACLRRARTIDLVVSRSLSVELFCFAACVARSLTSSKDDQPDCQSLSVCRAFLLRSACLSVRLTVESYAVRWPTRSQNRSKITPRQSIENHIRRYLGAPKIEWKSFPGCSPGTAWRPRVSRRHLGSVSGASRSVPGAPRERPKGRQGCPGTPERAPWSAWEHAEETKIDTKSRPETEKSSFLRAVRSRSTVGAIFRRCLSNFDFSAKSANP